MCMFLSEDKQASTSRYLDDFLNIDIIYFDNRVSNVYPAELQLNKTNTSDPKASFLDCI